MNEFIAVTVFAVALILLFLEKWHRVVTSALGASAMVVAGRVFSFYDEETALHAISFETLGLLLGMMIVVVLLQRTGLFEYVAIRVAQRSGNSPARLLLMLSLTTSILSMLLDNVTTVVFMAPVTVLIARLLGLSPIPLLIAQAIFSNIGGMATLVGDPPNILIGVASGLTFMDFLIHMGPMVLGAWIATYLVLRYLSRHELAAPISEQQHALQTLDADKALTDRVGARRVLIVLGGIAILFALESVLHIAPAFAALAGAGIALAWTQQDSQAVLSEIEWDVLLFFSGLFVMVGGLESAGVLQRVAEGVIALKDISPTMLGLIVMWTMVILSALIDNIPVTIAVIPIVLALGAAGINIQPLWWAVALGAGLGGNATPIGATANIVVMSVSDHTDYPITYKRWLSDGLPTTLIATAVTSVLYVFLFSFLSTR
jgi:Na+/H+ antiporter NhaD/arsenite permease-like protein